jgi:ribonuclease Y
VRREIGRLTLERLINDGRIHPQRIEEAYERGKAEIEQICQRAGEDTMTGLGITDMHPELVSLLGRLRYRTSYGQNVLNHLVESAHIAGMMASELGLDPMLLRRCAVLHDIGKGLTHEVEGSHALIGAEVARKYGESEDVVHAIEAHHNEVEVRTVEAVLTQAADAMSGGRPGASRWRCTSGAWSGLSRSRPRRRASRRSSPCRPAARSASWSSRTRSMTSRPR